MDNIEEFPILRVTEEGKSETKDLVTTEFPLTIILNNQELVTLLCSPTDLKYLAIGFLFYEGLLKSKDEIKKIIVDDQRGMVRVETEKGKESADELVFKQLITSGGGKGLHSHHTTNAQSQTRVKSQVGISAHEVFTLVEEFAQRSHIFKATGGVHSAALCNTGEILVFTEDIGRHNAIDKIFGECILKDIPTEDRIVITSGRISSEILLKVAKRNIPILISKSAPTDVAVRLADDLGITLIGFVREERMNVYTNRWRVVAQGYE